jgi:TonB family protein
MPDWQSCEGQLLDGKYPLEKLVDSDEASALFLIGFASAAVRIVRADAAQAAALVERWNRVKQIHHPHLLEIDDAGTAEVAGEPVAYVVIEHAEENLAEILQGRALTWAETRDMLLEVAGALESLHGQGLAHRDVKAANILAIGDAVKISSESVGEGDAAEDIRALGSTLVHALTQQPEARDPAAALPTPFGEIAKGCLEPDPAQRWTAKQIVERLERPDRLPALPAPAPVTAPAPFRRLAVPAGLALAGVAVVAAVMVRRTDAPPPQPVMTQPAPAPVAAAPASPSPRSVTPAPARPNDQSQSTRDRLVLENGVVHRVLPTVPEKARQTIDGRPAVAVRVTVDSAGNVTDAAVEKSFSSYFSKFALQAARQWKFVRDDSAARREWILRFAFTQTNTLVVVQRSARP